MYLEQNAAFEALWRRLLAAAMDKTDGFNVIEEFVEAVGMHYFSFEVYSSRAHQIKGLVLNNLPKEHAANYNDNAQYEFDPTVLEYSTKSLPFTLGNSADLKGLKGLDYYVFAEARGYGIGEALCIPLRSVDGQFSMFAVTSDDDFRVPVHPGTGIYNAVVAFAPFVQAYWMSQQDQTLRLPPPVSLSDTEKICLRWAQRGKTSWEIGQIIGRSQWTVDHHLTRAMHKLNTVNKAHAVATAVRLGLI